MNVISGHRDGFATNCPGKKLYAKLGTARSKAAKYRAAERGNGIHWPAERQFGRSRQEAETTGDRSDPPGRRQGHAAAPAHREHAQAHECRAAGVPFLTHQLARAKAAGVEHIVLATSYLAEVFEPYFGDGSALGLHIEYVTEEEPLGTGGAIRNVASRLHSGPDEPVLIFNGDILTGLDIGALVRTHETTGADVSLHLTQVTDPRAYGLVPTDETGRVLAFLEKPQTPEEIVTDQINAGAYVFRRSVIDTIPTGRPGLGRTRIRPRTPRHRRPPPGRFEALSRGRSSASRVDQDDGADRAERLRVVQRGGRGRVEERDRLDVGRGVLAGQEAGVGRTAAVQRHGAPLDRLGDLVLEFLRLGRVDDRPEVQLGVRVVRLLHGERVADPERADRREVRRQERIEQVPLDDEARVRRAALLAGIEELGDHRGEHVPVRVVPDAPGVESLLFEYVSFAEVGDGRGHQQAPVSRPPTKETQPISGARTSAWDSSPPLPLTRVTGIPSRAARAQARVRQATPPSVTGDDRVPASACTSTA
ncbi:UTP--glucose-1-phosphate uridylyltransferase [Streptomyces violarus]